MEIDIKHIAKLSRLQFTDEQIKVFEKQMQDIVKMVEKLGSSENDNLALNPDDPMVLREDISVASYARDKILLNAPMVEAGCFVVPKTVDAD